MSIRDFEKWLRYEKRAPEATRKAYFTDLQKFELFLKESFDIDSLVSCDAYIIKSWVVHLMETNLSRTSIKRKVSALNTYFKYLLKKDEIQNNPVASVEVPKAPKRVVKDVEEFSLLELLDQTDWSKEKQGHQKYLILELLYGTGIRLSELIHLKVEDVKKDHVKVVGKGDKQRLIPINRTLTYKLNKYINTNGFKTADSLFKTSQGKPLYPMYVYRVVKKALTKVTSLNKKSPHVIRHSFATHLLNKGADINAIKKMLGHENLAATQVYTHNSIERLKNVYNQAHPKA